MPKEKKKWESPKVLCLYRGRPEEAVLGNCKISMEYGPGVSEGCNLPSQTRCQKSTAT